MKWMRIDWLDLPKLTTFRTAIGSWTFRYPRHITLESDSHPLWMMFRHPQSHRCVSFFIGILLQEWRHNQRQYSLHPFLTNRHRSSSRLFQQPASSCLKASTASVFTTPNKWRLLRRPFFCFSEPPSPHQPTELTHASCVAPWMVWKETNNENRHFKSSESNQNRWNNVNSGKSP